MKDEEDYAEPSPIQIRVYENKLEIINGGVLIRLRLGDAVLNALSRLARMTDSPHRSSVMMLRVFGQRSSLNIRKGLLPKATKKLPKRRNNSKLYCHS